MDIVAGDLQTGTVGRKLATALVVRVADAAGRPVQGQLLNFSVTSGGGSTFAGSALSDSTGQARERWTLGTVARDTRQMEARAIDTQTGQPLVFATFRVGRDPRRAGRALESRRRRAGRSRRLGACRFPPRRGCRPVRQWGSGPGRRVGGADRRGFGTVRKYDFGHWRSHCPADAWHAYRYRPRCHDDGGGARSRHLHRNADAPLDGDARGHGIDRLFGHCGGGAPGVPPYDRMRGPLLEQA